MHLHLSKDNMNSNNSMLRPSDLPAPISNDLYLKNLNGRLAYKESVTSNVDFFQATD
jgi:hypothetical protein